MATRHREVYFIQDRLPLRWCFSERQECAEDIDSVLNLQRDLSTLIAGYADESGINKGLTQLLNQQIDAAVNEYLESHQVELKLIAPRSDALSENEVTLSSTGMGFFSEHAVSDGEVIEIEIFLAAIETSVRVVGSVLDSRASSDAENPGYWLRTRFVMGQEHATKAITAHIAERQRLALEKRATGANKLSGDVNEA